MSQIDFDEMIFKKALSDGDTHL